MNVKPNRLRLASIAFIGMAILLATTPLLAGSQYGSNSAPVSIRVDVAEPLTDRGE